MPYDDPGKDGMADKESRCALCGGPVDASGQAAAVTAFSPSRVPPVPLRIPEPEDDSLAHLTPGERFARAVERRDALIRDRRKSDE